MSVTIIYSGADMELIYHTPHSTDDECQQHPSEVRAISCLLHCSYDINSLYHMVL